MTTSARTASTRRGRRNPVEMVVTALMLLGVLASLVLVFSDTVVMLRVWLVVALWAAIIGAMAMTKYRRSRRRNGDGAVLDGAHTTGVSVAEIMANLRAESADPVAAARRRRK